MGAMANGPAARSPAAILHGPAPRPVSGLRSGPHGPAQHLPGPGRPRWPCCARRSSTVAGAAPGSGQGPDRLPYFPGASPRHGTSTDADQHPKANRRVGRRDRTLQHCDVRRRCRRRRGSEAEQRLAARQVPPDRELVAARQVAPRRQLIRRPRAAQVPAGLGIEPADGDAGRRQQLGGALRPVCWRRLSPGPDPAHRLPAPRRGGARRGSRSPARAPPTAGAACRTTLGGSPTGAGPGSPPAPR